MLFSNSPRVVYGKNPLEQVICQLRFPPILKIGSELPVEFQEAIRQAYPLFNEKQEGQSALLKQLPPGIRGQLPPDMLDFLTASGGKKVYDFSSEDEQWTVTLTNDFIALTSRRYERWEDFIAHFEEPFKALLDVYSPAFFTRIGLRYRNVIRRSTLGFENVSWSELIQSYIAGVLAAPGINAATINSSAHRVLMQLPDDHKVRIAHGLAEAENDGEVCYLIDNDFFSEQRTEIGNARERLNDFNQESGRLFRWCITDRLHEAMIPKSI